MSYPFYCEGIWMSSRDFDELSKATDSLSEMIQDLNGIRKMLCPLLVAKTKKCENINV